MTYSTDRLRFMPRKMVRTIALTATLLLITAFVLFAPAPSLAAPAEPTPSAPAEPTPSLSVVVRPGPDSRIVVTASVFSAEGERVMENTVVTSAGTPVSMTTDKGGRSFRVQLEVEKKQLRATLEVVEGEQQIHRSSQLVPLNFESSPSRPEPVLLKLVDADLHDVLQKFTDLSGTRVSADPSIQGKVTIDTTDVPWPQALRRAVAPLGLNIVVIEGEVKVVRASEGPAPAKAEPVVDPPKPIMKSPVVLTRVEPLYTEEARSARVAGVVIVEAHIDEQGVVRSTKVLKPLPMGLDRAAEEAVKQWIFAPGLIDGKPVPVVFNVVVHFDSDPE